MSDGRRIARFLRKNGFVSLWDYFAANPRVSTADLARPVGALAMNLEAQMVREGIAAKQIARVVRDLICRDLHERANEPRWPPSNVWAHPLPEPYMELAVAAFRRFKRGGTLPASENDPALTIVWNDAVLRLPTFLRELVANSDMESETQTATPGSRYEEAIGFVNDLLTPTTEEHIGRIVRRIPHELAYVYLADLFARDVRANGLTELFMTSSGAFAAEMVESLHIVGLTTCAIRLKSAMALFGARYPRNRVERRRRLARMSARQRSALTSLTNRVVLDVDAFNQAADEYIARLGNLNRLWVRQTLALKQTERPVSGARVAG